MVKSPFFRDVCRIGTLCHCAFTIVTWCRYYFDRLICWLVNRASSFDNVTEMLYLF